MIAILTGAGISQESGIETFRSSNGLWEKERVEDVATPRGFLRNPDKVFAFYNARRKQLLSGNILPNLAHTSLAKLEAESAEPVVVITQNIDNLHELAGTKKLFHMHGEILKARCNRCNRITAWHEDLDKTSICPECKESGHMRPHIVWFEEMPLYMNEIEEVLGSCRIFASIGTSGNVYPAAGFAGIAKASGAHTVELNLEPSKAACIFNEGRYGKATEIVPLWVNEVLQKTC